MQVLGERAADSARISERCAKILEDRLASGEMDLPLLPDVACKLMSERFDEESDVRALSDLIHRDQAMAGHVLRVANSAAYSPTTPIVTLQQAVTRLGMVTLKEILLAVAVQNRVFKAQSYAGLAKRLWQAAAGAGAFAKEIARMRRTNVEGAFLCGLLHDVGKPVVLQTLSEAQRELKEAASEEAAAAALETYHTRAGQLLAERWALPALVREAIVHHHDWMQAQTAAEAAMTASLADALAAWGVAPDAELEQAVRAHPALAQLNLYPDDVEALLEKRERVQAFVEAFA